MHSPHLQVATSPYPARARRQTIDYLRWVSPASLQATSISLPAAQQVISAMDVISGADGSGRGRCKIMQLRSNANTMRRELEGLGLGVLGSYDSPVVVHPLDQAITPVTSVQMGVPLRSALSLDVPEARLSSCQDERVTVVISTFMPTSWAPPLPLRCHACVSACCRPACTVQSAEPAVLLALPG